MARAIIRFLCAVAGALMVLEPLAGWLAGKELDPWDTGVIPALLAFLRSPAGGGIVVVAGVVLLTNAIWPYWPRRLLKGDTPEVYESRIAELRREITRLNDKVEALQSDLEDARAIRDEAVRAREKHESSPRRRSETIRTEAKRISALKERASKAIAHECRMDALRLMRTLPESPRSKKLIADLEDLESVERKPWAMASQLFSLLSAFENESADEDWAQVSVADQQTTEQVRAVLREAGNDGLQENNSGAFRDERCAVQWCEDLEAFLAKHLVSDGRSLFKPRPAERASQRASAAYHEAKTVAEMLQRTHVVPNCEPPASWQGWRALRRRGRAGD